MTLDTWIVYWIYHLVFYSLYLAFFTHWPKSVSSLQNNTIPWLILYLYMPFAFGNNAQVAKFKEIRLRIGLLQDFYCLRVSYMIRHIDLVLVMWLKAALSCVPNSHHHPEASLHLQTIIILVLSTVVLISNVNLDVTWCFLTTYTKTLLYGGYLWALILT